MCERTVTGAIKEKRGENLCFKLHSYRWATYLENRSPAGLFLGTRAVGQRWPHVTAVPIRLGMTTGIAAKE